MSKLFTIGFTQKSAKEFFNTLQENNIDMVADVRLSNTGQLAGFTKKDDLAFFLSIFRITYEHWVDFAPSKKIRDEYRLSHYWDGYEKAYRQLLIAKGAVNRVDKDKLFSNRIALLCSEPSPEYCHRRIAAEEIRKKFPAINIIHL